MAPAGVITSRVADSPACSASGICPKMLLNAYNVTQLQNAGTNGTGQAVVIDDACGSTTIVRDLDTFDSVFGLPNPTLDVLQPQGTPCNGASSGWNVETSLDVEWSHVMAPGATIVLLEAAQPTSGDLYGAWSYALTNSLGNEISNSWGGSGACGSAGGILKTAAADHVTILASAGDGGAWGKGTTQGIFAPADCKDILTVGGTTLNTNAAGDYLSETAWSPGCAGAGGGGYVTGAKEPGYQTKAGITDTFALLGKPDVSADANPCTGVWIFVAGTWEVVGGTSVSCPLWAGFIADVNQIRASNGFAPAGLINSFLYKTVYGVDGSSSLYSQDFHDIILGNNGWPAGPGWDAATGLGSFVADNLAQTLGSNAKAGTNST
jgi:subtilase family serine protease